MKITQLLERIIPVKERLMKLQQDLIELCDDVSDEIIRVKVPFKEHRISKFTHWDRFAILATVRPYGISSGSVNTSPIALVKKPRRIAVVVDTEPNNPEVVCMIVVPKSEKYNTSDHQPTEIDIGELKAYMLERNSRFVVLASEDEAVTGMQDGIDKIVDLIR